MGYLDILSREILTLSPQQAKEILHYVGYIKSLSEDVSYSAIQNEIARKQVIRDGFRKLQESKAFDDIDDPVEWQRKIRKDRPLPRR
ncbi:MAG: hypothetical protein R3E93_11425 [Thiothrix sp.]